MAGYTRVLLHLRHDTGSAPVLAKFTDCVLTALHLDNHSDQVVVELEDNKLILSRPHPASVSPPVLLSHPPFCPAHCLTPAQTQALPTDTVTRGVDVGVVVLLETSDKCLLLTRRAQHMRTFPGTWVPPGGHVEEGEGLLAAGLRELEEETGLVVSTETVSESRVLALWESVFPYCLEMGQPKRHHIVTYYWVRTIEDRAVLQARLELDSCEVDAAMWLTPCLTQLVATGQKPPGCPASVELTVLDKDNKMCLGSLPTGVLTQQGPDSGADVERISTGTRYALQRWLARQEGGV